MGTARATALFWGLLLIAAGVLFLLGNLELLPAGVVAWWPLLVAAAGLWLLGRALSVRQGGGLVAGTVLLALGGFWLLETLAVLDGRVLLPVVLIAIGVGLLLRTMVRW
jgi:hypothetical protein